MGCLSTYPDKTQRQVKDRHYSENEDVLVESTTPLGLEQRRGIKHLL